MASCRSRRWDWRPALRLGPHGVVTKRSHFLFSAQAVMDMNGKEVRGRLLYVGRAQKRVERQNELKRKFEQMKQDRLNRYHVRVSLLVAAAPACRWPQT